MTVLLAFGALVFYGVGAWIIVRTQILPVQYKVEASVGPKPTVIAFHNNASMDKRVIVISIYTVVIILSAGTLAAVVVVVPNIYSIIKSFVLRNLFTLLVIALPLLLALISAWMWKGKVSFSKIERWFPGPRQYASAEVSEVEILRQLFGIFDERQGKGNEAEEPIYKHFVGTASLLTKVYRGDSHPVILQLEDTVEQSNDVSLNKSDGTKQKIVKVQHINVGSEKFLEVELMAAGLQIDGAKKQQRPLLQPKLTFRWNCYFERSGNYQPFLILRTINSAGNATEIGVIQYNVAVITFFNLTQRQTEQLAWMCGGISGLCALLWTLRQLGWV